MQSDPGFAEAQHNLGLCYAEQGRPADAIAAYRRALAIPAYTTPEVAYHNLGNAYLLLGRLPDAAEAYRTALQLDPKQVGSIYSLGVVLVREGRREEAKAAFRMARDLEPTSAFRAGCLGSPQESWRRGLRMQAVRAYRRKRLGGSFFLDPAAGFRVSRGRCSRA